MLSQDVPTLCWPPRCSGLSCRRTCGSTQGGGRPRGPHWSLRKEPGGSGSLVLSWQGRRGTGFQRLMQENCSSVPLLSADGLVIWSTCPPSDADYLSALGPSPAPPTFSSQPETAYISWDVGKQEAKLMVTERPISG